MEESSSDGRSSPENREGKPEWPRNVAAVRYDSISGSPDGSIHLHGMAGGHEDMTKEEVRGKLAEGHGIDASDIAIGHDEVSGAKRSGSVGFTRWNSSWDPHAEKGDPTQN